MDIIATFASPYYMLTKNEGGKDMEIRQLKYFVSIADTGRFSDASRQLYISQSAISQQIKALEDELGVQLFLRTTHSVTLTEAGHHLLPLARKVLSGIEDCHNRISDLKGMLCGELNIGLTYTMEPYAREAMLAFMKSHPKVKTNAHYKNLPELLGKLRNNDIDMMLSMMPTSPHEFCDSVPLMSYRLMAVMRKGHPLSKKECLTFEDLQPHALILPEKGIRDRNAIESYVHTDTGTLNIRSLINDANAILNILQETNYVSILAENTIANRSQLCAVPIAELSRDIPVYAHFNKDAPKKQSAEAFLECFRNTSAYFCQVNDLTD